MAAFSNSFKTGDDRRDATGRLTTDKPRSFGALAQDSTPDSKSTSNSLSINYGNGTTDWGPNSIWSNGSLGNGFASRGATRENSRDGSRHVGHEDQMRGSMRPYGSFGMEDPWNPEWRPSTSRSVSSTEHNEPQSMSQQRSTSFQPALSSTGAAFGSRPPISLNTSLGAPSGQRHADSGSIASRGYEPAPTVYTKHDRQQDPHTKTYRDSAAAGPWTSVSPTDTRRPFPPNSRTASQPMSRDGSQAYATPTDERRPTFTSPDYGRAQQRPVQNNSRGPSLSSQRLVPYNSFVDPSVEQLPIQFGQMSMNGDSRPQTSYRSNNQSFSDPWSTDISPLTRASMNGTRTGLGAVEDPEEFDGDSHRFAAFSNALSPMATDFAAQGHGGRYPPTPLSAEFRPGQGFMSGQITTRGFDMATGYKGTQDWQNRSNGMGAMQLSRPSLSAADQQALMTPQMQQLLAAQLRQHYNPMFNPYAMHGAILPNPYLSMMPMAYPTADPETTVQGVVAGENIQSALLYEFKNQNKSKRYELRDIYDHIAEFSGDQHGSRFIQTKLETANSDEKARVFAEIEPNAIQLMTDVFGNYVIQKFFEHGDQVHKRTLAIKMKGQVLALTNQMYGCRVVQKALDHVLVEQQTALVKELEGHVLRCVKDQNGNHVIQKAIERCPSHTIGFIIASFQHSVQQLSVNSYGCRVIQRCLEHCEKPARAMIMSELMDGIQGMITDQYGNYVVQHVVERDEGEGRQNVLVIVMKHLEMYSKHKFASNVVEKCLERADDEWRRDVMMKLSSEERRGPDGESVLVGMIKDNYGNYVIQKLLDTLHYNHFSDFLESLHPAVSQAKRTGCGKQIQSVERKMERFSRAGRHCLPAPPPPPPQMQPPMAPTGAGAAFAPTPHALHYGVPQPPHHHFASNFGSTGTTPPPLTADQSQWSSGMTSLNGDAVEGAQNHRHGHCVPVGPKKESGVEGPFMR